MKTNILKCLTALILGLASPQVARAQGAITFVTDLSQTSAGSLAVANDSWLAASFYTGANIGGYLLNSVQLSMTDGSGDPNSFSVAIYSAIGSPNVVPGTSLETLNGTANPAAAGVYTFGASGSLTLVANTAYFIVLTAGTTSANGAYGWSYAGTYSYATSGGWQAPYVFGAIDNYQSSDGLQWSPLAAPPQFAINATAAPEPGTLGLLALGGMLIGLKRWNEKKRS